MASELAKVARTVTMMFVVACSTDSKTDGSDDAGDDQDATAPDGLDAGPDAAVPAESDAGQLDGSVGDDRDASAPDSGTPTTPSVCDELLGHEGPSGDEKCKDPALCMQIEAEPDRIVTWRFGVAEDAVDDATTIACIEEYAAQQGFEGEFDDAVLTGEGTYTETRALWDLDAIVSVEISCSEEGCESCSELTPEECTEDLLCYVLQAQRVLTDGTCSDEFEDVGCNAADSGCAAVITYASSPSGQCWMFTNGCIPPDWDSSDDACQLEAGVPPMCF